MPRLSMVIPGSAFDSLVEDTLVSVLQNRPEYSEIIVVGPDDYSDPYGLGREVKFLTHPNSRDTVDLINFGCEHARGDVVHVLLPGALATDGWTDHIWEHFTADRVGAVSPVILATPEATRIQAAGVSYLGRGERRLFGQGSNLQDPKFGASPVLGPVLDAGFYRRDVLMALGGFDGAFGSELADVELGLALQDLGYRAVVDLQSKIVSARTCHKKPQNGVEAHHAEQLFRRGTDESQVRSWQRTGWRFVEFLSNLPRWRAVSCLRGRWSAAREASPREAYQVRLEQARSQLQGECAAVSQPTATITFQPRHAAGGSRRINTAVRRAA